LGRRLKSLPLHPNGHPQFAKSLADAFLEWRKIRQAKGYGFCWQNWILAFEAVPYINPQLPTLEDLETMIQITRIDCDHTCMEESRQRAEAFR
jgi:hypothetical protein